MNLRPCPFCGSDAKWVGDTNWAIRESHLKPTMSGPGAPISVEVQHWCGEGTKTMVKVVGRDHDEAERNWNRRA